MLKKLILLAYLNCIRIKLHHIVAHRNSPGFYSALKKLRRNKQTEKKIVNNYEGFKILPYLEANKLTYHRVIYTGKRHDNLGSEMKDFKAQQTSWTS